MKKVFLIATLAISVAASAFTPTETKINFSIEKSFKNEFNEATNVQWSKVGSYSKALFVLNNRSTEAFFTDDGELVGTSHAISLDDLPVSSKRAYAKKYSDYTVKEAIQFEGRDDSAYFISAQKDDKTIILKVEGGRISIYKPGTESIKGL
jgi:hypothetical protein